MSAVVVLTALLLAAAPATATTPAARPPATAAPTAEPSCNTFTRASLDAPPVVHAWLARSSDDHVRVCQATAGATVDAAAASYSGESAIRRQGDVCSYTSHRLQRVGSGSGARLERYERSDVQVMALANSDCPDPGAASTDAYVPTFDVSPRAFEAIMQLWAAAAASTVGFDQKLACCSGAGGTAVAAAPATLGDSGRRLRSAIDAGRMKSATVARIVRMSASVWQRRYALFVANPDSSEAQARLYVIYVRKPLRGQYHITGIADTN